MITEQEMGIRAILADPEDDAPRLVYADWLEEHGQGERAEFCRVQCELATLGPPPVQVTEPCYIEERYGPNYYTLTGGEETEGGGRLIIEAKVGGRVDVLHPKKSKRETFPPLHGLRVHKITDEEIVVVKDAKSRPWGGTALHERERWLWVQGGMCDYFNGPSELRTARLGGFSVVDTTSPETTVRRGFVESIRCTTAAFLGDDRECPRCHQYASDPENLFGSPGHHPERDPASGRHEGGWTNCKLCNGGAIGIPGRVGTPGLAGPLFARQPVTQVVLTNQRAYPGDQNGRVAWFHPDVPTAGEPRIQTLPPVLFFSLVGFGNRGANEGSVRWYDNRTDADAALSDACVKLGRGLADPKGLIWPNPLTAKYDKPQYEHLTSELYG